MGTMFNIGLICCHLKLYVHACSALQACRNVFNQIHHDKDITSNSALVSFRTHFMTLLGIALWKVGDVKSARRSFQEALSLEKDSDQAKDTFSYTNFALFEFHENENKEVFNTIVNRFFDTKESTSSNLEKLKKMSSSF